MLSEQLALPTPSYIEHPIIPDLRKMLEGPLPEGAAGLVEEAIAEYQSAYRKDRRHPTGNRLTNTTFRVDLPEDGPETLLAGKNHLLTVKFGADNEPAGNPHHHMMVIIDPRNIDEAIIYPGRMRLPALDIEGRSNPINFLLVIPGSARNRNCCLEVTAISGSVIAARLPLNFRLV